MQGQSRIDNLETLKTWETKDITRGQTKQIPQQRKLQGQSRIDNLETLPTWETKDIRQGQTKQNSITKKIVGAIKN